MTDGVEDPVPLFVILNGRTVPSMDLDDVALVVDTAKIDRQRVRPYHQQVLDLCQKPTAVREIAGHMKGLLGCSFPTFAAKILVADLIDIDALRVDAVPEYAVSEDVLNRVLTHLKNMS